MFLSISILMCLCFCFLKPKVYFYILVYGFSFIIFSFALDGMYFGYWNSMIHNIVPVLPTYKGLIFWFFYAVSFMVFFIFLKDKNININPIFNDLKYKRSLHFYGYFFFYLSFFSTLYNLSNVPDFSLIFTNPRAYEVYFGSNVIVNYLYFQHLLALVIFAMIFKVSDKVRFFDVVVVVLLLIFSILHGIKFTIIHAFLFLAISVFLSGHEKVGKYFFVIVLSLTLLMISFFAYVRGGVENFMGYVFFASVNSIYSIELTEWYNFGSIMSLSPFDLSLIDKFYSRIILGESFQFSEFSGFLLNDKFNAYHALSLVGFGFGFPLVFISFLIALLINKIRSDIRSIFHLYLLVFLVYLVFFMFTAWELSKLKLLAPMLVLFILHRIRFFKFFERI